MALFFSTILAGQFRKPSGLLGRYASRIMLERNKALYDWVLSESVFGPDRDVLEIGFGPGYGILQVLKQVSNGRGTVTGIDFSSSMCKKTAGLVQREPARDKVKLEMGDAAKMPFRDNSFDIAFAVNVVYFWTDLTSCFDETARVLRPGGRALFYLTDAASLQMLPIARTGVFQFYTPENLVEAAAAAGLGSPTHKSREIEIGRSRIGHLLSVTKST